MTRDLRQLGMALLIALTSVGLVIGGLSLSLADSSAPASPTPTQGSSATPQMMPPTPTLPPILVSATATINIATATISIATATNNIATNTSIPSQSYPYASPTQTSSHTACGPPFGWVRTYIVQPGDTLFHIAYLHYTTTYALQQANCKGGSTIIHPGERLWVPNVPPRAPSVTAIPDSPTPYPTDPLTETPLPFTLTPDPTESPMPNP